MAEFKIFFRESVYKDFKQIPKKDLKQILNKINGLAHDPRPSGCQKLSESEKYRIRQGKYRILYSVQDDELTIWIVRIAHRKDVYR